MLTLVYTRILNLNFKCNYRLRLKMLQIFNSVSAYILKDGGKRKKHFQWAR